MYQFSLGFLAAMLNGVKQCGIQRGGPASWHDAGHSSLHTFAFSGGLRAPRKSRAFSRVTGVAFGHQ